MRLAHKHFTPGAPLPPDPPDLFEPHHDGPPVNRVKAASPPSAEQFGSAGKLAVLAPSVSVDTSREAAARIQGHTNRLREAVILFIRAQGARGATAGEIELGLGLSGSTVRPRLREAEGTAPWAKGKLPRRIQRTSARRAGMRVYVTV